MIVSRVLFGECSLFSAFETFFGLLKVFQFSFVCFFLLSDKWLLDREMLLLISCKQFGSKGSMPS